MKSTIVPQIIEIKKETPVVTGPAIGIKDEPIEFGLDIKLVRDSEQSIYKFTSPGKRFK